MKNDPQSELKNCSEYTTKATANELLTDDEFLKHCGKIFAHDLIRYSENGGDMQNITANKVYKFLEELNKK